MLHQTFQADGEVLPIFSQPWPGAFSGSVANVLHRSLSSMWFAVCAGPNEAASECKVAPLELLEAHDPQFELQFCP